MNDARSNRSLSHSFLKASHARRPRQFSSVTTRPINVQKLAIPNNTHRSVLQRNNQRKHLTSTDRRGAGGLSGAFIERALRRYTQGNTEFAPGTRGHHRPWGAGIQEFSGKSLALDEQGPDISRR